MIDVKDMEIHVVHYHAELVAPRIRRVIRENVRLLTVLLHNLSMSGCLFSNSAFPLSTTGKEEKRL